jgi:hypothetical protein
VTEGHTDRQGDQQRQSQRQEGDLQVLAREVPHLVRSADHRLPGARLLLVEDEVDGVAEDAQHPEMEDAAHALASVDGLRHGASSR